MSDDKPTEPEQPAVASDESETKEAEAEAAAEETEAEETEAEASSESERTREKRAGRKKRRERERAAAAAKSTTRAIAFGVVGLAVGAAAGWFGHVARAKANVKSDAVPAAVPAASGSAVVLAKTGACAALEKELCAKVGDSSAACEQAKGAATILTSGTCEVALDTVPVMVEKVKVARAGCDALVARLCKDLTPESGACTMVKERTPSFPPERCAELTTNYEQVLAEIKQMEAKGAIPGNQPPGLPGHGPGDGHGH